MSCASRARAFSSDSSRRSSHEPVIADRASSAKVAPPLTVGFDEIAPESASVSVRESAGELDEDGPSQPSLNPSPACSRCFGRIAWLSQASQKLLSLVQHDDEEQDTHRFDPSAKSGRKAR